MALKQYREAARTAIIIAREEQCSGKPFSSWYHNVSDATALQYCRYRYSYRIILYNASCIALEQICSVNTKFLIIFKFSFEFEVAFVKRLGLVTAYYMFGKQKIMANNSIPYIQVNLLMGSSCNSAYLYSTDVTTAVKLHAVPMQSVYWSFSLCTFKLLIFFSRRCAQEMFSAEGSDTCFLKSCFPLKLETEKKKLANFVSSPYFCLLH